MIKIEKNQAICYNYLLLRCWVNVYQIPNASYHAYICLEFYFLEFRGHHRKIFTLRFRNTFFQVRRLTRPICFGKRTGPVRRRTMHFVHAGHIGVAITQWDKYHTLMNKECNGRQGDCFLPTTLTARRKENPGWLTDQSTREPKSSRRVHECLRYSYYNVCGVNNKSDNVTYQVSVVTKKRTLSKTTHVPASAPASYQIVPEYQRGNHHNRSFSPW